MPHGSTPDKTCFLQAPHHPDPTLVSRAVGLLCGFGLLALTATAETATYYVATSGDDGNPGTLATPFRTIQQAADTAKGGDTVYVLPGTYPESITSTTSGTATARIVFESQTKWGAHIIAGSSFSAWWNDGEYVDIINFDMTGSAIQEGMTNSASYVRIIGNHVHDFIGTGIDDSLNYSHHDVEYIGNVVHDVGEPGSNQNHGLYLATKGGRIINNIVYRVVGGYCIHLWHAATDVRIAHNTVSECGSQDSGGGIVVGAGDSPGGVTLENTRVENNIVIKSARMGIYETGKTGTNNHFINNLTYGNATGNFVLQNGDVDQGTMTLDPKFVNPSQDDFHLQSSSPAIDAGVSLADVSTDFDGTLRPQGSGYDLGAYEFKSGGSLRGDLNRDGKRDLVDVRLLIYMLLGQQPTTPEADLTGDGAVTLADVQTLIKLLVGF